jgi:hypothetical protein
MGSCTEDTCNFNIDTTIVDGYACTAGGILNNLSLKIANIVKNYF